MLWRNDNSRFPSSIQMCVGWIKKRALFLAALFPAALIALNIVGDVYFEVLLKEYRIAPRLESHYFVTTDNSILPFRAWLPEKRPTRAIMVALHGVNDYSNFFNGPGNFFKNFGIASYAYDQRGFGKAPGRGSWAEINQYTRDLAEFTHLIRDRYPGIPLYLLGESMGAAVIIVAMSSESPPLADGVILSAPAVWSWDTIPWYQRMGLWLASHTVPWLHLSGAGLHLVPSDNMKMLHALVRDPLVLKETRIGTIYGLAELMDQAFERANRIDKSTLVLYGERDQIVPKRSVYLMLDTVPPERDWRVALYENGYHLLLRDLEAPRYWRDIAAWITNPRQKLPSGADRRAAVHFWQGGSY